LIKTEEKIDKKKEKKKGRAGKIVRRLKDKGKTGGVTTHMGKKKKKKRPKRTRIWEKSKRRGERCGGST